LRLVLDVRDGDGDTALALLGSLVDLVERRELVQLRVLVVQHLGDRRGQRRLAVVDVPDGADVYVRLVPLELGLSHWNLLGLRPYDVAFVVVVSPRRSYSPRALAMISSATALGTSA